MPPKKKTPTKPRARPAPTMTASALSTKEGWMALWAGRFDSLEALEAHIDTGELEREQGVVIEPPLLLFNAFRDGAGVEALARELVKDAAVAREVAAAIGADRANSLLLFEHVDYDASRSPAGKKRMRYLGRWKMAGF